MNNLVSSKHYQMTRASCGRVLCAVARRPVLVGPDSIPRPLSRGVCTLLLGRVSLPCTDHAATHGRPLKNLLLGRAPVVQISLHLTSSPAQLSFLRPFSPLSPPERRPDPLTASSCARAAEIPASSAPSVRTDCLPNSTPLQDSYVSWHFHNTLTSALDPIACSHSL
jgi:hypothetical protein